MKFITRLTFYLSTLTFLLLSLTSCQETAQSVDTEGPDSVLVRELQSASPDIREGTDFYAFNLDQGWDVMLDLDEATVRFHYISEPHELTMPLPESTSPGEIDAVSYMSETEKANLQITIVEDTCFSDLADETFPYRVEVQVKTATTLDYEELSGCGRYLGEYRLNGAWVMVARNGNRLDSTLRPPSFTIDLAASQVAGFTGCNRFEGQIDVRGDTLAMGPWMATEKNCIDMDFPQVFRAGLSGREVKYKMENEVLTMQIGEKEIWQMVRPS